MRLGGELAEKVCVRNDKKILVRTGMVPNVDAGIADKDK